jgi:glutamyl-tRNA synthetase
MLAFLGWNPGTTQEIFSLEELVRAFTLERVSKAGAKFDPDKTKWFQQHYLRAEKNDVLAKSLAEFLDHKYDPSLLSEVCQLMKERATFIQDIWTEGSFLLERPTEFDEKTIRKKWKADAAEITQGWANALAETNTFSAETIESRFKQYLEDNGLGMGSVLPLFRLVLTGKGMGPSMFDIAAFLGKEETIARINSGIEKLSNINTEA